MKSTTTAMHAEANADGQQADEAKHQHQRDYSDIRGLVLLLDRAARHIEIADTLFAHGRADAGNPFFVDIVGAMGDMFAVPIGGQVDHRLQGDQCLGLRCVGEFSPGRLRDIASKTALLQAS